MVERDFFHFLTCNKSFFIQWGFSSTIFISLCALHKLSFQQEFAVKKHCKYSDAWSPYEEATPHSTCLQLLLASSLFIMIMNIRPPRQLTSTSYTLVNHISSIYSRHTCTFASLRLWLPPGGHGITEGLGRATCHGWALETSTAVVKMIVKF